MKDQSLTTFTSYIRDLEAVTQTVRQLEASLSTADWKRKPSVTAWSAVECIDHLNITSRAFLPLLEQAAEQARTSTSGVGMFTQFDSFGWLLIKGLGSKSKYSRSKTADAFVPQASLDPSAVVREFYELQSKLVALGESSKGLPLNRIRIASPFNTRIRYTAFSAFGILAVHADRHTRQAIAAAELQPSRA
jgi:hypothetical protein